MGVSYTKSQLGKMLVDLTIKKIDRWALNQLNTLQQDPNFPIYVPISDRMWIIGAYKLERLGAQQWRLTRDGRLVHVFYSKQAAVFYAVFNKFHRYADAHALLENDKTVAKMFDEVNFYTAKLEKKSRKVDEFKQQLWTVRFAEVKAKYQHAREDLEKRLGSAKYKVKFWEQIL